MAIAWNQPKPLTVADFHKPTPEEAITPKTKGNGSDRLRLNGWNKNGPAPLTILQQG